MKLKFTENTAYANNKVVSANQGSLDLCGQGRSRGEGDVVLPILLREAQSNEQGDTIIAPLVSIKTATTRNKKGTTSALLRVAMPYTAFRDTKSYVTGSDGTQVIASDLVQDATRSGGELSMHLVIAIPSAMAADLAKTGGAASADLIREAAQKQLVAVAMLLRAIAGTTLSPDLQLLTQNAASTGFFPVTRTLPGKVPGTTVGGAAAIPAQIPEQGFFTTDVGEYGPGINMSDTHQRVHLDDALGRIVRGQPALACADIEVPARAMGV